jgi:hypothetical protein
VVSLDRHAAKTAAIITLSKVDGGYLLNPVTVESLLAAMLYVYSICHAES